MKNIFGFVLLIIALLSSTNTFSQDTLKISKSNNKVFLSGKAYYIHIIRKGETLYRIAMAYNVSVEDIEKENFNIKAEGLTIGQPVKIPVAAIKDRVVEKTNKEVPRMHIVDSAETAYSIANKYNLTLDELYALNPSAREVLHLGQKIFLPAQTDTTKTKILTDKDFIYHVVKPGDTFFSIATNYGFKERQLKKYNEDVDINNLQPNQIIKIPLSSVDIITQKPEKTEKYYYHNVKPQETLFFIGLRYKISENLIKEHNPELKQRELLAGEYIKLPLDLIVIPAGTKQFEDSTKVEPALLIQDTCQCNPIETDKLQVAFFLPLYSYANDTINRNSTRESIYSRSKIFVNYYQGVLLALNALSEKGLNVDAYIYDTENDTTKIKTIVSKDIFPYFDLIFGPVYGQNLPIVVQRAKQFNIPVISPLSTNQEFLEQYPLAFQVSPHDSILYEQSISHIRQIKAGNYVIINNGNRPNKSFATLFKQAFFKGKKLEEISHLGYNEITYYAGDGELKLDSFIDSVENVVIIPSDNQAFVSDVVSRLNTLNQKYKITLFGHPRWINFDNIDIRFFHNLNTHLFNLSYIDYEKPEVKDFVYKFRKFYSKEPEKYAFYGYDITYYFLHAYQLFGKSFYCCFNNYHPELLQMKLEFKQISTGQGFVNNYMELLNFGRNFLLTPVRTKNK